MKVMDFLYKILGFETDDVKTVKKKASNASYNLKVVESLPEEIQGIKVFYPKSLEEAKENVNLLKKNTPFFIDYRNCTTGEKNKIIDYYQGVIDILGASEEEVEKNLYIYLPKNMQLEKE